MMLHEEDGTLQEHLDEAYAKAMSWADGLIEIIKAADAGNYDEALALAIASELPPDVRARLEAALVTEDPALIRKVVEDYKGRLGNVFCESCWNGVQG